MIETCDDKLDSGLSENKFKIKRQSNPPKTDTPKLMGARPKTLNKTVQGGGGNKSDTKGRGSSSQTTSSAQLSTPARKRKKAETEAEPMIGPVLNPILQLFNKRRAISDSTDSPVKVKTKAEVESELEFRDNSDVFGSKDKSKTECKTECKTMKRDQAVELGDVRSSLLTKRDKLSNKENLPPDTLTPSHKPRIRSELSSESRSTYARPSVRRGSMIHLRLFTVS